MHCCGPFLDYLTIGGGKDSLQVVFLLTGKFRFLLRISYLFSGSQRDAVRFEDSSVVSDVLIYIGVGTKELILAG